MENYIGIDVSLELSSVCVVDASGAVLREAKVESDPEAIAAFIRDFQLPITRVGLEAGPLSQWRHDGICERGYNTVLFETRHVKAALSAMVVKTDRRDARAVLRNSLRMGWYRSVHRKSASGAGKLGGKNLRVVECFLERALVDSAVENEHLGRACWGGRRSSTS